MASKLTLIDISSGFKGTDVNTNFTDIEDEFDDTLSRSGKSPNAMNAELDMNSYKIQNLGPPTLNQDAARLKDLSEDNATSKAATAVTIDDSGGYYASDNVEGALQETAQAKNISIIDTANHYSGSNVEAILKEIIDTDLTFTADHTFSGDVNFTGDLQTGGTSFAVIETDTTFNVPTDYDDLQAAIDDLGHRSVKTGVIITVNIESGHALTAGLDVRNGSYGHFKITSDDATVLLDAGFTPVDPPPDESFSATQNCIFFAKRAVAPTWSILIDAEQADVCGYHLLNSIGRVDSGFGVNNANRMGVTVNKGSMLDAEGCSFGGSGEGNRISTGSIVNAAGGDFSGFRNLSSSNVRAGIEASKGAFVNISASSDAAGTDISGCTGDAVHVRRSTVSATYADLSNATSAGVVADIGSSVDAGNTTASGCGSRAVSAKQGSFVNVQAGDLTNAGDEAIFASNGARINAHNSDVTGFNDNSSGSNAIDVFTGSIVAANGVSGSPTFNVTTNAVSSDGIIFN